MNPVHNPQRTVIDPKLLMVQIMNRRRRQLEKVIPAMIGRSFPELKHRKRKQGKEVSPLERQRGYNGKNVGKRMFNGMSVLGRKANRRRVLVTHLVDMAVDPRMVQGAVDVVERDFAGDHAECKVTGHISQGWEVGVHDEEAMVNTDQVDGQSVGCRDPGLVQHGYLDAVPDLCPCWLASGALEFVSLREVRSQDVDEEVYRCRDDKSDNLAKYNTCHFDLTGFILGTNVGPDVLGFVDSIHVCSGFSGSRFNASIEMITEDNNGHLVMGLQNIFIHAVIHFWDRPVLLYSVTTGTNPEETHQALSHLRVDSGLATVPVHTP